MASFETPAFLQNKSVDDFYDIIKKNLPPDIDLSEGGHGWNMTRPIAIVAAEICEFILPEVVKLILPEWSYGEFLAGHAKGRGMTQKEAVAATGELTITGTAGLNIPVGSLFSVPAVNAEPSIDYETTEAVTINDLGTATVGIRCTQAGVIGNTAANTIVLVSSKITDITAVTNAEAVTGGTEAESDEALIERISEYDTTQGYSFVGNDADYKRWAKEAGAGSVSVVPPEDDSGVVTLIITDEKGAAANETLIEKVYNHIMRPDNREDRLAPINALLSVQAPSTCEISIKAIIELEEGATIGAVKSDFAAQLSLYLAEALDEGEIKYSQIWAVLAAVSGVNDFKGLEIGIKTASGTTYGTSNIEITDRQLPTIAADDILLTGGTV